MGSRGGKVGHYPDSEPQPLGILQYWSTGLFYFFVCLFVFLFSFFFYKLTIRALEKDQS